MEYLISRWSTLVQLAIVFCFTFRQSECLEYVGCLQEGLLKQVRLTCNDNQGLQVHSAAYGHAFTSIDCGQPVNSPSDCWQNQISQTEKFRVRCNTFQSCVEQVNYDPLDGCGAETGSGQNYIYVQYECRSRMDVYNQPMELLDPLKTSTEPRDGAQVALQTQDYAQNTPFSNAICQISLEANIKVRIDVYDLSHGLTENDVPYCVKFGWKEVCAEKGQYLDVLHIPASSSQQTARLEFKRTQQAPEQFDARFWIVLSALDNTTLTYSPEMSISCVAETSPGAGLPAEFPHNPVSTPATDVVDVDNNLPDGTSVGEEEGDDTKFAVLIGVIPAALVILVAIIAVTVSCIRRRQQLVKRLAYVQHANIASAMKHGAQCNVRLSSSSQDDSSIHYGYTRYQPDGDSLKSGSPMEPYQISGATYDESTDCIYSNIPESPNGNITPYQTCQPPNFSTFSADTISPYESSQSQQPTFSTFAPADNNDYYEAQVSPPMSPTDSITPYHTIPGAYDPQLCDQEEIYQTQIVPTMPPEGAYAYTSESFMNRILPAHAAATSSTNNLSDTAVRSSRAAFIQNLENLYAKPVKPAKPDVERWSGAGPADPRAVRRLDSETEVVDNEIYRYSANIGHI